MTGIPRPGWSGRRRAILREVLKAIATAVIFIGLLVESYVYIWLAAPAGAGYPR